MQYNTNDPISLACKWEEKLADRSDGRVKWMTVAPVFGFTTEGGDKEAVEFGFEGLHPEDCLGCSIDVYCEALNQAWAEALGEHSTALASRLNIWRKAG